MPYDVLSSLKSKIKSRLINKRSVQKHSCQRQSNVLLSSMIVVAIEQQHIWIERQFNAKLASQPRHLFVFFLLGVGVGQHVSLREVLPNPDILTHKWVQSGLQGYYKTSVPIGHAGHNLKPLQPNKNPCKLQYCIAGIYCQQTTPGYVKEHFVRKQFCQPVSVH